MPSVDVPVVLSGSAARTLPEGSGESWSTITFGAGNGSESGDIKATVYPDGEAGSNWMEIRRGVMRFNTGAYLDSGWTVTDAVLWIYLRTPATSASGETVECTSCSAFTSITSGNYSAPGFLSYDSILLSTLTTTGWKTFDLSTAAISKTGYSHFGLRLGSDVNDIEPVSRIDRDARFYGTNGSGYTAFIRVTYTIPDTTVTPTAAAGRTRGGGTPSLSGSLTLSPTAASKTRGIFSPTLDYIFNWTLTPSAAMKPRNLPPTPVVTEGDVYILSPVVGGRTRVAPAVTVSIGSLTVTPTAASKARATPFTPEAVAGSGVVVTPTAAAGRTRGTYTGSLTHNRTLGPTSASRTRTAPSPASAVMVVGLSEPLSVIDQGRSVYMEDDTSVMRYYLRAAGDEPFDLTTADSVSATMLDPDGNTVFTGRSVAVQSDGLVVLQVHSSDFSVPGIHPLTIQVVVQGGIYTFPTNHSLWVNAWEQARIATPSPGSGGGSESAFDSAFDEAFD